MVSSFRPLKILLSMETGCQASITEDSRSRVAVILKVLSSLAVTFQVINARIFQSSTILCLHSRPQKLIVQVSQLQAMSAATTTRLSSATILPTPSTAMVRSSIGTSTSPSIAIVSRPRVSSPTRSSWLASSPIS